MSVQQQWRWEDMPVEIWENIMAYLDVVSLNNLIKSFNSEYMNCILTNVKKLQINYYLRDISRIPFDCYDQIMKMGRKKVDNLEACKIYVQWKFLSTFESIEIEKIKYKKEKRRQVYGTEDTFTWTLQVNVSGRWLIIKSLRDNENDKQNPVSSSIYRFIHLDTNEEYCINTDKHENNFHLIVVDYPEDNSERVKPCKNENCLCLGDLAHDYICEFIHECVLSCHASGVFKLHHENTSREITPSEDLSVIFNDSGTNYTEEEFIVRLYQNCPLLHHGNLSFIEDFGFDFNFDDDYRVVDISVKRRDDTLLTLILRDYDNYENKLFVVNFYETKKKGEHINENSYNMLSRLYDHWLFNGSIMFGMLSPNELLILTIDNKIIHPMKSISITCILLTMNLLILGTVYGQIRIYKLKNINELFNEHFNWSKPNYSCFPEYLYNEIAQMVPVEWSKHFDIIVTTYDEHDKDDHIYRLKINFPEII